MDKKVLLEYMDACELLKETEAELAILKRRGGAVLHDSVKGSMHDFPYVPQNFHIECVRRASDEEVKRMEQLLEHRAAVVMEKRGEAEKCLNELAATNPRMVRIFKYKFIEGMTWDQVAKRLGRKTTGESVRKEWKKFEKNKVFPFFPFFPLKVCYVVFGERVNRGQKWDMVQMRWPCVTFFV